MASPADRYIRQVTQGLLPRKRIDTAAELRVHLNGRARELMLEGFSREEAEHLAVMGMGPPASVNRRFLGHLFTAPLGWLTVVVLVLGGTGWWVAQALSSSPAVPVPQIATTPLAFEDVLPFIGNVEVLSLELTDEVREVRVRASVASQSIGGFSRIGRAYPPNPHHDNHLRLIVGFPAAPLWSCPDGGTPVLVGFVGFYSRTCYPIDMENRGSAWDRLNIGEDGRVVDPRELELNAWTPVLLYRPSREPWSGEISTDPEDWLIISLWVGDQSLTGGNEPEEPSLDALLAHPSLEGFVR
ncbi:hypothetical protein BH24DEI1_BH24DEI1_04670 [soil metagenome]|jgi:hypothetical protein|nr:permease prefix domain 1-containing protein [Deinococcota bacterium]